VYTQWLPENFVPVVPLRALVKFQFPTLSAFIDAARILCGAGSICNGQVSARPSVYPSDRQQQWEPAGLLLSSLRVVDYISIDSHRRAAGAVLQTPALSSKCGYHRVERRQQRVNEELFSHSSDF